MKALSLPDVAELVGRTDPDRAWLDGPELRRRAHRGLHSEMARELWKYTPLVAFLETFAAAPAGTAGTTFTGIDQPGISATSIDQLEPASQARLRQRIDERFDPERHPLADLSLLRAAGGWLIEVTAELREPLHIHYPPQGIAPVFLRVADHASCMVVEHLQTTGFLAQIRHVELAASAHLDQHLVALDKGVPHYALLHVRLDRDAGYRLHQCCVGGARRREEVHVVLDAPGAEAELFGAYLVEDGQHLDQQLVVEHRAGHTRSRQKFHGIGAGKGRSVFNGRIHIHPHAPHSDAELSNKNLALHADAEMNTKPELEIYTDDVRCAHGATVGRLPEDALFYLTARGVPEAEARRTLAFAFLRECLAGPLADAAIRRLREALTA